jgi:hypothetical protein
MKNKFNIPHHKGITILRHPDIIEEYNTLFYYVHRRIKNYNGRYTASVFGIGLKFELINQKTINYVARKKR